MPSLIDSRLLQPTTAIPRTPQIRTPQIGTPIGDPREPIPSVPVPPIAPPTNIQPPVQGGDVAPPPVAEPIVPTNVQPPPINEPIASVPTGGGGTPATFGAIDIPPAGGRPGEGPLFDSGPGIPFGDLPSDPPTVFDPASLNPASGLAGLDLSTILPGSSLIGTQITPDPSERLLGVQGQVGGAADRISDFGGFNLSPEALEARSAVSNTLREALNAPDRLSQAQEAFDLLVERSNPAFEEQQRDLRRQTAALGRVGSGLFNTQLSDVASQRENDLGLARRELGLRAAGQTLEDRLRSLSAAQSAAGFLGGQDVDLTQRGFEADRARLSDLAALERQIFGEEASTRGEVRGERDFQNQLERQALQDAIDQILLQENLFDADFRRRLQEAELLGRIGV